VRFEEVYVRPFDYTQSADQPLVTLSRDARGQWWHTVGGQVVREATRLESLLMLAPETWKRLGTPAVQPSAPAV
jgi:hypothetical protein